MDDGDDGYTDDPWTDKASSVSVAGGRSSNLRVRGNNAMRRIIALLVVAVISACGTAPATTEPSEEPSASASVVAPSATPTTAPTSTPSPTPSPTPDVAAIGEQYTSIVDARNEVACRFNAALSDSPSDLALLQERAAAMADAERTAADALRAIEFPTDIQPMIDEAIAKDAALEAALRAFSAAPDLASANVELQRAIDVTRETSGNSNLIRGELGLPSVPADLCG